MTDLTFALSSTWFSMQSIVLLVACVQFRNSRLSFLLRRFSRHFIWLESLARCGLGFLFSTNSASVSRYIEKLVCIALSAMVTGLGNTFTTLKWLKLWSIQIFRFYRQLLYRKSCRWGAIDVDMLYYVKPWWCIVNFPIVVFHVMSPHRLHYLSTLRAVVVTQCKNFPLRFYRWLLAVVSVGRTVRLSEVLTSCSFIESD